MNEVWQYPYVDIFKSFDIWEWKTAKKIGDVSQELDSTIGRKVIVLKGTVWTNHYIILPSTSPSTPLKSLALKGRYIYLSISGIEGKNFTIHLDFAFAESKNVRISLSNIYKEEKYDHFSIQVPLPLPKERWTIVCIDARGYFDRYHCCKEGEAHFLRSMMMCANLKISRVATADKLYDHNTLPRDLNFKLSKGDQWLDKYSWLEPLPCDHCSSASPEVPLKPVERKCFPIPKAKVHPKPVLKASVPIPVLSNKENVSSNAPIMEPRPVTIPAKNPLIALQNVIGCSTNVCSTISWSRNPKTKEILYTAGNLLVAADLEGTKRFFIGHSSPVVAFVVSPKGDLVASADEKTIKIWSVESAKAVASWGVQEGHRAKCVAISQDAASLITIYKDPHNHDVVTVWDLGTVKKISPYQPHPDIVATQISQSNVLAIKCAPSMDGGLQFCTCGQENIRFWRVKKQGLRSGPVVLDKQSRNTVFTSVDYEGKRRVYVGSKEGTVLQVNAESQELEFVYKLHDSGIHSLAVNEGFCVTGSDDQYLRVWPLDFSEFFMEAKHEATVVGVDISFDGVLIICATAHGSLGLLDLSQQKYRTLARSHIGDVLDMNIDGDRLVTISSDKTMRVWDLTTYQQSYEFCAFDDQALCVALYPNKGFFACGFESGCLRIFDIERTAVVGEYRMFDKPLIRVHYLADFLLTLAADGSFAVHNATTYDAIKQVLCETSVTSPFLSVDHSSKQFAVIGKSASSVNIWSCAPLQMVHSFTIPHVKIVDLKFVGGDSVTVLCSDGTMRNYSVTGDFIQKRAVSLASTNGTRMTITANNKYAVFAGPDSIVRVLEPAQTVPKEYAYHTSLVKVATFHPTDPTLFFTAGGPEGVFVWRFPAAAVEEPGKALPEEMKTLSMREDDVIKEARTMEVKAVKIAADLSVPVHITEPEPSPSMLQRLAPRTQKRAELGLPLRHYVSDHDDKQVFYEDVSTRPLSVADHSIRMQKLTGYNGSAHDNLVYFPSTESVGFTVGHKLVVEEFASGRQEIYLEQEAEISCVALSPDSKWVATATGIPNKSTSVADILVYSVSGTSKPQLTPAKNLSFYQKGVQTMAFDSPNQLWTAGRYPENTVAVWDVSTGVCLASDVLSDPIHCLLPYGIGSMFALTKNAVIRMSLQQESRTLVMETFKKEGVEFTSGATITEMGIAIFGTREGSIVVFDPVKQVFVDQIRLVEGEITSVGISGKTLLVAGGDKMHYWRTVGPKTRWDKPEGKITVTGGNVVAMTGKSSDEIFVGTTDGAVEIVMLGEAVTAKMNAGNANAEIKAVCVPTTPKVMIAAAGDGSVKVYSVQNSDLLVEYPGVPDAVCQGLTVIHDCLIGGFTDGSLHFYSLTTFKQLGKAQISSTPVTSVASVDNTLFVGNSAGAVFVATFLSLDPVSLSLQKLELDLDGAVSYIDIDQQLVTVSSGKGDIGVWEIVGKFPAQNVSPRGGCELRLRDKWNIFENPHGVEVSAEDLQIYKEKGNHNVSSVICRYDPDVTFSVSDSLQYVYIRNIATHSIQKRVVLDLFPSRIVELPARNWVLVTGTDGTIKVKNVVEDKEENVRPGCTNIQAATLFADGTGIVTGGKGEIIKWALEIDN